MNSFRGGRRALTHGHERRLTKLRTAVARFPFLIVRVAGRSMVITDAERERAQADGQIRHESAAGSHRHDTISTRQRFLVRVLPLLDGVIFAWFVGGILNISWSRPDIRLAIAIALAVLVTLAVAAWNHAVGERLQVAKSDTGGVEWENVGIPELVMLVLTVIMALLVGALMQVRVADEIVAATGIDSIAGRVVALTLSAAAVLLNLLLLVLAFNDGSPLTRRRDRLAKAIAPHRKRHERNIARMNAVEAKIRQIRALDREPGNDADGPAEILA